MSNPTKRKWLTSFAWTDDGGKSICIALDAICQGSGLAVTAENLRVVATVLRGMIQRKNPRAVIKIDPRLPAIGSDETVASDEGGSLWN